MASPVTIPTPVADGSMADAQSFVNSLPGSMSPQQRSDMAADNQGWHPRKTADNTPDFIPEHGTATGNAPDFIPAAEPSEPPPKSFDDPRVGKLGYYVNGDGNVVIAPKEGENYEDTIRRAVTHSTQMSPEERHAALERETGNAGKKVATTLAVAPAIGLGGAAMLALTAESGEALKQIATKAPQAYQAARTFIYNRLAAATPELFGEEAAKETLKRLAVKAAVKTAMGGAVGAGYAVAHQVWEELFGK